MSETGVKVSTSSKEERQEELAQELVSFPADKLSCGTKLLEVR